MIPITKPFLPPIEEYQLKLNKIWERNWLTNNGYEVRELELKLKEYLRLQNLLFVSNGTIAIQIALKALGITKKVITTPFSYVATTSSIVWEGCVPIFVDIDPNSFNIDASKIEAAIDEDTEAILATHCFGNPCDIERINKIAKKYNLKIIYDAAHCFGTLYKGKSIFSFGDISTVSFHATKLYHSVEGGAVFCKNNELIKRMAYMRNFGHDGPEKFNGIGINAKNSEFHAAMGVLNLNYIEDILKTRKAITDNYNSLINGLNLRKQTIFSDTKYNYSYYPIVFETEEKLLLAVAELNKNSIFPRRYFYPSLNNLSYIISSKMQNSDDISSRILCLPVYHEITNKDQKLIIECIKKVII